MRTVSFRALAATATAGLVLSESFIGTFIFTVQYGQRATSIPGFTALTLLWDLGLLVTAVALVWATVIALRMKRWGWAIGLVFGTLALFLLTALTLPGLLILVFAVWGPTEAATRRVGGAPGQERAVIPILKRAGTQPRTRLRRGLVVRSLVAGVLALIVGNIVLWVDAQQFHPAATLPGQLANVRLYIDDGRTLSAVRASDGQQLWSVPGGGGYSIASADGVVYTDASGVALSADCCTVDAIQGSDGSLLWQFTSTGDPVRVIGASEGLVYVGEAGSVTAVQASDGKQLWQFTTGSAIPSVAAVDGMTFISGDTPDSDSGGGVYALRSSDGTKLWKWEISEGGSFLYQPAVAEGVVYVGSEDGNVYALTERTGTLLWQYQTGFLVHSTPAIANGTVYAAANGDVTALDAHTGAVIWRYHLDSTSTPSPQVADGVVYANSDSGDLYGLQAVTGKKLWSYHVGAAMFDNPPLAVSGAIFYGAQVGCFSLFFCSGSYLYAFRASDGAPAWRLQVPYGPPTYATT